MTNLQGDVQQLQGRINNHIRGVKGLKKKVRLKVRKKVRLKKTEITVTNQYICPV